MHDLADELQRSLSYRRALRPAGKSMYDDMIRAWEKLVSEADPMQFLGMNVVVSPLCTARDVPVRMHEQRNHSRAYHARVQKKWNKRFGTTKQEQFFLIGQNTVCVSPEGMLQLRRMSAHYAIKVNHDDLRRA